MATSKSVGFLWTLAGRMEVPAATVAYLAWEPGGLPTTLPLAVIAGGDAAEAGYMGGIDNGYGDYWNETWTTLPLGWYARQLVRRS